LRIADAQAENVLAYFGHRANPTDGALVLGQMGGGRNRQGRSRPAHQQYASALGVDDDDDDDVDVNVRMNKFQPVIDSWIESKL
jgi:hypothetical protein